MTNSLIWVAHFLSDKEVYEREEIRKEREKERRRDRAIQRAAPEKRTQLQKEKERDISEKIALGLPNTGANTGELQYDSRLFSSAKVGLFDLIL